MNERRFISIIDDDQSVRESLPDLLKELGFVAEAFSSAEQFLRSGRLADSACLLLDIAMPDMSGIELKEELDRQGSKVPIIFITAHGDDDFRESLKGESVECLLKPFGDKMLLEAIETVTKKR